MKLQVLLVALAAASVAVGQEIRKARLDVSVCCFNKGRLYVVCVCSFPPLPRLDCGTLLP